MNPSPITLAVTLGDPTGIGPEVALKSLGVLLAEDDDTCFVLLGDRPLIARLGGVPGWDRELPPHVPGSRSAARVTIAAVTQDLPEVLSPGHPRAAKAAMAWLRRAGEGCLCGEFNGMVTGPVNKGAILNTGQPFVGQCVRDGSQVVYCSLVASEKWARREECHRPVGKS